MNNLRIFRFIALLLVGCGLSTEGANIVGIYTYDMKSHYLFAQNMLIELAKSGHNVTVFTRFKSDNLPENFKEITLQLPNLDGKFYVIYEQDL